MKLFSKHLEQRKAKGQKAESKRDLRCSPPRTPAARNSPGHGLPALDIVSKKCQFNKRNQSEWSDQVNSKIPPIKANNAMD